MGEAVLIFLVVVLVLFVLLAIGMVVLTGIPIVLESIAEIKEAWRELRGKGGVE